MGTSKGLLEGEDGGRAMHKASINLDLTDIGELRRCSGPGTHV